VRIARDLLSRVASAEAEKVDTASLGRISMTDSVKISLMALRGYLVVIMLLVYHVIDLSGALGTH